MRRHALYCSATFLASVITLSAVHAQSAQDALRMLQACFSAQVPEMVLPADNLNPATVALTSHKFSGDTKRLVVASQHIFRKHDSKTNSMKEERSGGTQEVLYSDLDKILLTNYWAELFSGFGAEPSDKAPKDTIGIRCTDGKPCVKITKDGEVSWQHFTSFTLADDRTAANAAQALEILRTQKY